MWQNTFIQVQLIVFSKDVFHSENKDKLNLAKC